MCHFKGMIDRFKGAMITVTITRNINFGDQPISTNHNVGCLVVLRGKPPAMV